MKPVTIVRTPIECLDYESPISINKQVLTGDEEVSIMCADKRCLRDPDYFEIYHVQNRNTPTRGVSRVPGLLKRCNSETFVLDFVRNEEPEYSLVREYGFTASGLYAEVLIPSHIYQSVRDELTGRLRANILLPKTLHDLPRGYLVQGSKLRVRSEQYDTLLDFCRFSIHTHVGGGERKLSVCCKRTCSRPEPLTKIELLAIKCVASNEPYYACSWLEKRILFKWHVGEEKFEPYLCFSNAIAVYNGLDVRHDSSTTVPFSFRCWKTPDEEVMTADEIYFTSPINLAGYKWYEPTSLDRENMERYKRGWTMDTKDRVSEHIAKNVMNLKVLPDNVLLSSTLVVPCTFSEGMTTGE